MVSRYWEKIYFDGDSYFAALISDIVAAKESIDFETYIFKHDDLGRKIINALRDAALRGVNVRVMVDGAGTPRWGGALVRKLERAGALTRIFHPFPWRIWQLSRSYVRYPSLLKSIYLLLKINSRDHRKSCIIDSKIAYVGSFNVDKRHLNHQNSGDGWRDTAVCLRNLDLTSLIQAFDCTWNHKRIHEKIRQTLKYVRKNPILRLNNNWLRRKLFYKKLISKLKRTKKRVWITNAYFIPDNYLLHTLREVAKRGVDVRILLPRTSDVMFMPWASAVFYAKLLEDGTRIFEYLPSVLHAKTLVVDDWMIVGSSNLNHRSLLHDLEVDVNIRNSVSKRSIEVQFNRDLELSKEVKLEDLKMRRLYQRILGRMILYVKYLI